MEERRTRNAQVWGSTPHAGSILFPITAFYFTMNGRIIRLQKETIKWMVPPGRKGRNMDETPDDIEIEIFVGEMFLMYLAYDDERQMKN